MEAADEAFWSQFWSETVTCVQDVFALIPAAEIRALREESPSNLATLCYKAVEKLVQAAETGCHSHKEEQTGNHNNKYRSGIDIIIVIIIIINVKIIVTLLQ